MWFWYYFLFRLVIAALFHNGIKDGIFQDIALGIHEFSATMSYVLIAVVSAAIYSRVKGEEFGHQWFPY